MQQQKEKLTGLLTRWATDPASQQLSPTGKKLDRIGLYLRHLTFQARKEAAQQFQPGAAPGKGAANLQGLIYDVGANRGDNLAYYLDRAALVIAIEANPELCDGIRARFAAEVAAGRLLVLHCAVGEAEGEGTFWIHPKNPVLSTLVTPQAAPGTQLDRANFTPIPMPISRLSQIVATHGAPEFVKVDVEGMDAQVLGELFAQGIKPPYISAECHDIEVFCQLVAAGYTRFKVIEGIRVGRAFQSLPIALADGSVREQAFPSHSAGPFGEDIPMAWIDTRAMFRYLAEFSTGWKDLHARLK